MRYLIKRGFSIRDAQPTDRVNRGVASEFAQVAQQTKQLLRIIVKTNNLKRLSEEDGIATKTLAEFGE
jgi:hypothetical protein